MDIEALECEKAGFEDGRNPMFGDWNQAFNIKPVANGRRNAEEKQAFYDSVRNALTNHFVYTHQVAVTITLYHDEQHRLETTLIGDLDNYAKTICDAISGSEGILIDDCQIHSLTVCWIDRHANSPEFEVSIKASPDDFQPSPIKLYEMSDSLYYPLSENCWTAKGTIPYQEGIQELTLLTWESYAQQIVGVQRECQKAGVDRTTAFHQTMGLKPQPWGFHRNRINNSGFQIILLAEWTEAIQLWLPTCTNEGIRKLVSDRLPGD